MPGVNTNPLGMSDEDFLKMSGPAPAENPQEAAAAIEGEPAQQEEPGNEPTDPIETEATEGAEAEGQTTGETATDATSASDSGEAAEAEQGEKDNKDPLPASGDTTGADGAAVKAAGGGDKGGEKKPEPKEASGESPNYQAFYEQIMTPFKANGRTIELKTPEEAIQLMQMGANYTKKMQDIQPHRKVLMMLQNHDLLDEGKLSFLIDLDKKDPEAIKKLVKDAGIDPMDIDTAAEPSYSQGNHSVSDEEASFREVLQDVASSESGAATVQLINTTWDTASKEMLWKSPDIMSVIHQQKEAGVYDTIVAEMDRRKTLGQISANTPFLEAYKTVGEDLYKDGEPAGQSAKPERQKVAEKVIAPKPKVQNGDKASAAAQGRSAAKVTGKVVNPLSMSDDDFLAQFKDRL